MYSLHIQTQKWEKKKQKRDIYKINFQANRNWAGSKQQKIVLPNYQTNQETT